MSKISQHQQKYKNRYDRIKAVKEGDFKPGDIVKIKLPASGGSRVSKYSNPVSVERVRNNVVTLENGQTWGMDKLAKCGKEKSQNHRPRFWR